MKPSPSIKKILIVSTVVGTMYILLFLVLFTGTLQSFFYESKSFKELSAGVIPSESLAKYNLAAVISQKIRESIPLMGKKNKKIVHSNPFLNEMLYVEPNTPADQQALAWEKERPADAALMAELAAQPRAIWFSSWNGNVEEAVRSKVATMNESGKLPVLVAYNVPSFQCSDYDNDTKTVEATYLAWIKSFAQGIGNNKVIVILEPDAIAGRECINDRRPIQKNVIRQAVAILKAQPNAYVYIDAGHSVWNSVDQIVGKLEKAGIGSADGFVLNVSNFITNEETIRYGTEISSKVEDKHFLIDTSRNGNGPTSDYQWCNPRGRAVGVYPTVTTGHELVDAFLWVKQPGESDGTCNGGPLDGVWWPEYALELMVNRSR